PFLSLFPYTTLFRSPAHWRLPFCAAIPVLLDDHHHVQAERGAALARGQPVLGEESDARAHQEAIVRHSVSRLAVEHDSGVGGVEDRKSTRLNSSHQI